MAALEVVHKRLNEIGLSDFCLTLHSHKANKKEVLAELGRTLNEPKFRMKDEAYDQLESLKLERDKLNQYDKQLHTVIPPLNKSIFDINGKLTKLCIENTPSIIFSIPNIRKTTTDQVFNYLYLIKELSRTLEKLNDDYYGNVWWGCKLKNITHEQRNNIDTNLSNLSQNLNDLAHLFDEIINELGMESNSSINLVVQAIRTLEIAQNSPRIPLSWIYKDDILPLMELANQYYDLVKEYRNINIELHNKVRDGFFQLPAHEASDSLTKSITNVHGRLNKYTYENGEDVINLLPSLINQVEKWIKNFDSILTVSETSINLIGTNKVKTLSDAKALSKLYDDLLLNPKIPQEWFNKDKFTATKRIFNEARIKYQEIDTETSRILQRFEKEILDIDHSAILIRFKAEYTSILKYINGNYYSDCKSIKTLCKSNEKFSDHNLISLLIELKNLSEKRAWLKENENLIFNLLGNNYLHEYTDWNSLNSLINTFQRITTYFEVNDVSPQIKKILTADYVDQDIVLKSNSEEIKFIQNDLFLNDISINISISQNASEVDVVEVQTKLLHLLNDLHVLEKIYRQLNNFVIHEVSIEVILNYLDNLGKLQTINQLVETNTNVLKEKYNFLFKGIETDWNIIIQALIWTKEFRTLRDKHSFKDTFIENICGDATKIKYSRYACETLKQKLSKIQTEWEWFLNLFDDIDKFINMDLHKLLERINLCKHDMSALEDWIDYRNCIEKCHDNGLSQYVEAIENNKIHSRELVSVFEKRFYRLWLDAVTPEFPAVQNFRSEIHEDTIRSFVTLDSTQLRYCTKKSKRTACIKVT